MRRHVNFKACFLACAVLLMLCPIQAHADTDPKKIPAVAAALQSAQNVFLLADPSVYADPDGNGQMLYKLFAEGLEQTGRYRFVSTLPQADLILRFEHEGVLICTVSLFDPRTLQYLGMFQSSKGFLPIVRNMRKTDAALLAQAKVLYGKSHLQGAPSAATVPTAPPAVVPASEINTRLRRAKSVILFDAGSRAEGTPLRPGEMTSLARVALKECGQYQITDSPDTADLMLGFVLFNYGGCTEVETTKTRGFPRQSVCSAVVNDFRLQMFVQDAKTLQPITFFELVIDEKKGVGLVDDPAYYKDFMAKLAAAAALPQK